MHVGIVLGIGRYAKQIDRIQSKGRGMLPDVEAETLYSPYATAHWTGVPAGEPKRTLTCAHKVFASISDYPALLEFPGPDQR